MICTVPIHEHNDCHHPAGSPVGGQFCGKGIRVVTADGPIGLAAEARKAGSFEAFKKDFGLQIKHGIYWHFTSDPAFKVDLAKGPRDMSSLADGEMTAGALMITSDLDAWEENYPTRQVALLDMSDVPRAAYYQVQRGFGNEFYVADPSKVKVLGVMSVAQARRLDQQHQQALPQDEEELLAFYRRVTGKLK